MMSQKKMLMTMRSDTTKNDVGDCSSTVKAMESGSKMSANTVVTNMIESQTIRNACSHPPIMSLC